MNIQGWVRLESTGLISFQSKGLSGVFSSTISSSMISLLYDPNLTFVYDYWKNHSIDYGKPLAKLKQTKPLAKWCLCFLIHCLGFSLFLPRSKHFISRLQLPSIVILEPKKIKSVTASTFFSDCLPWGDGIGCHDLNFQSVEWKPPLSLSSFTLIKRLLSSSSLSAIGMISSLYMRLLIFLLENLILACDSSSLAFCMMFSAYKVNKQDIIHSFDILLS